MKDMIFIGWSGTNSLAVAVKKLLDKNGYLGVVGGNYEGNPDTVRQQKPTVNETIRYQMDRCSQAIMIFKKTNETISGNLVYELGYLASRYNDDQTSTKLHIFKIDIDKADEALFPSDLHGIWGYPIASNKEDDTDYTDTELAEKIVDEFLRCQKLKKREHKIELVNNFHHIEYELDYHTKRPLISDYELAKKILYYLQAAYIFQEYDSAKSKCRRLHNWMLDNHVHSPNLNAALEYALLTLDLFLDVKPKENDDRHIHMSRKAFRTYLKKYRKIASVVGDENASHSYDTYEIENVRFTEEDAFADSFKLWMFAQVQQHVTFLHFIYLDDPSADEADRKACAAQGVRFGESAIYNLRLLDGCPGNTEYVKVHLAYAYRNLSLFYQILGDEAKAKENKDLSFEVREDLYEVAQRIPGLNPALKNYISLEYFLQVADMLKEIDDEDEVEDYLEDMSQYIVDKDAYERTRVLMYQRLHTIYDELREKLEDI